MYAGTANTESSRLALFLNRILGKNSPVNSITSVDNNVSAVTLAPSSKELKSVLSNNWANNIPYTTSTMLLPTSIVLTKPLGWL